MKRKLTFGLAVAVLSLALLFLTGCGAAARVDRPNLVRQEEKSAEVALLEAERDARVAARQAAEEEAAAARLAAEEEAAAAARLAEEEADAARSPRERLIRNTLRITSLRTYRPNSVGGVDVSISFENWSEETIKYMDVTFRAYNAVGDRVNCEIHRSSRFEGRITGPVYSGDGMSLSWRCAWYNHSIARAEITNIRIEYMNGRVFTLSGQDITWSMVGTSR